MLVLFSALGLGALFWFASRSPGVAAQPGALVFRAGVVTDPNRPPAARFGILGDVVPALGAGPLNGEDTATLGEIEAWSRDAWSRVNPRSLVPAERERVELVKSLEAASLYAFVTNYPASAWTPVLAARLGLHFRHSGEYSKALDLFEGAWLLLGAAQSGPARNEADRVLGEYAACCRASAGSRRCPACWLRRKDASFAILPPPRSTPWRWRPVITCAAIRASPTAAAPSPWAT